MRLRSILAMTILAWAFGQSDLSSVAANSRPSPLASGAGLGQQSGAGECGIPYAGIALCLHRAEGLDLLIEIKNTGNKDEVLNLGLMLANGRSQYPTAIKLMFMDAAGTTHVPDLGPPMIAGRVDPMVLPLPIGASVNFHFHASNHNVWVVSGQVENFKLDPRQNYTVQAEFTGKVVSQAEANLDMKGIVLMPYWIGIVSSNSIKMGP